MLHPADTTDWNDVGPGSGRTFHRQGQLDVGLLFQLRLLRIGPAVDSYFRGLARF